MDTQAMPRKDGRRDDRRAASPHTMPSQEHASGHPMKMGSYGRFAAMVATSTALGFAATYLNVLEPDHAFFSWTRLFMALVMGGVMTAVMMLFMWKMYPDQRANWGIVAAAAVLFAAGVTLARSQATVDDVSYMKAMIPHHSIAIMTSSRARIEDPRVRKLADGIIQSQEREIAEMKQLLSELERR